MYRKRARRGAAGNRKSEAGETLVESMAAIVIIALSSLLFITMFLTSGKIFRQAKDRYDTVYGQIADADAHREPLTDSGGTPISGTVTVKGDSSVPVDVTLYGYEDYVQSYIAG